MEKLLPSPPLDNRDSKLVSPLSRRLLSSSPEPIQEPIEENILVSSSPEPIKQSPFPPSTSRTRPSRPSINKPTISIDTSLKLNVLNASVVADKIGKNLTENMQRIQSKSAPDVLISSINLTKSAYELILEECYKEYLTTHVDRSEKISIDDYNRQYIEFIIYTLYNTFKSGDSNNITEIYDLINTINTYILYVRDTYKLIISSLSNPYDPFKEKFKITSSALKSNFLTLINRDEKCNPSGDINELDILFFLIKKFSEFLTSIIKDKDKLKTQHDITSEIPRIINSFGTEPINKLKIYFLFKFNSVNLIFTELNFRVIFYNLNSLAMREKIKQYYRSQEENEKEIEEQKINDILKTYSMVVDSIKKVYCLFEILYFFFKSTIDKLDTTGLDGFSKPIYDYITSEEIVLLQSQADFSKKMVEIATEDVTKEGMKVIDRLSKSQDNIYEKDIAIPYNKVLKSLETYEIKRNRKILVKGLSQLTRDSKFRTSISMFQEHIHALRSP